MGERVQCSRIAMSFKKESAFATPVADVDISKFYELLEPSLINVPQQRVNNASFLKGHEFKQGIGKEILVAQDVEIPFSLPLSVDAAGLLLALFTGADAPTGVNPNFVHPYVITDLCAVDQLLSTSWVLGLLGTTTSYIKAQGVILNQITISGNEVGYLNLSGSAYSDGTLTYVPSFTWPTASDAVDFLVNTHMDVLIDDVGGTPITQKSIFRGFDLNMSNNLDRDGARSNIAAAGVFLGSLPVGDREVTMSFKLKGVPGDANWLDYETNQAKEIIIRVTKDADRELEIRFREVTYTNCVPSFEGNIPVLTFDVEPFFNTTDDSPYLITVKNKDAAYLLA
jgi:hypothetical protein